MHPGRCAALLAVADGEEILVGNAGELHPRVIKTLGLPERTCAMEIDLDRLERAVPGRSGAPKISAFPVATQDVALVVDAGVPAAEVEGRCARARVNCWSRCGCSTSSPASRSARARSRWRTRCGSAPPTGR